MKKTYFMMLVSCITLLASCKTLVTSPDAQQEANTQHTGIHASRLYGEWKTESITPRLSDTVDTTLLFDFKKDKRVFITVKITEIETDDDVMEGTFELKNDMLFITLIGNPAPYKVTFIGDKLVMNNKDATMTLIRN